MNRTLSQRVTVDAVRPRRETLLYGSVIVAAELLVLALHAVFGNSSPLGLFGLRVWLYPLVWINVGLWALVRTSPGPDTSARNRRLAVGIALAYAGLLAYVGGVIGQAHGPATGFGVVVGTVPPGWAPTVTYSGTAVSLTLIPYKLVGYAALAYLVYATVVDAAGAAVSGLLGLLSCVSCSWPVLAGLVAGTAGSTSGVAAAATTGSYGLSTLAFVLTVAVLYWRPFVGSG
jgi:hypothetical protein